MNHSPAQSRLWWRSSWLWRASLLAAAGVLLFGFTSVPGASAQDATKNKVAADAAAAANGAKGAKSDGMVWGALFFTTDESVPEPEEKETREMVARLKKAFGGDRNFRLIGEHTQKIFSAYESWVVPSKDIFMKIDSKGPTTQEDGIKLHLQLWKEKDVLVKTDAILRSDPIFIEGPEWGKGRLYMVVELR